MKRPALIYLADGFGSDGITGLKALGIRDLTYRIAFLALFIKPQVERDTLSALRELERESEEGIIIIAMTTRSLICRIHQSLRRPVELYPPRNRAFPAYAPEPTDCATFGARDRPPHLWP